MKCKQCQNKDWYKPRANPCIAELRRGKVKTAQGSNQLCCGNKEHANSRREQRGDIEQLIILLHFSQYSYRLGEGEPVLSAAGFKNEVFCSVGQGCAVRQRCANFTTGWTEIQILQVNPKCMKFGFQRISKP